jgi:hypothetical protein
MDDRSIETHPDLMDPDWQKHAEREAWTEVRRTRRRSKRGGIGKPALWVTLGLVVLVGAAVVVNLVRARGANGGFAAGTAPATAAKTTPTTAPSVLPQVAAVDLTQPFANTPAALWKDGTAGFSIPASAAVGSFSAKQVADAYSQVTQAVARAHLERKTLEGHDTTAFLTSLAPNEANRVKVILDKPDKVDAGGFVTLVADGFHLLPTGPRLNGRLSAQPGAEKSELNIHAEYVIAYGFDTAHPDDLTSPADIVAFFREDETYTLRTGSRWYQADQGLSFGDSVGGETFSMACGAAKAGYLAPSYSERVMSRGPDGHDETAVYDLDKPVDLTDSC